MANKSESEGITEKNRDREKGGGMALISKETERENQRRNIRKRKTVELTEILEIRA